MGWGTEFQTLLYLDKVTFDNKYHVIDAINDVKEDISEYREKILMYCASTPNNIFGLDDYGSVVNEMHSEVNNILDCLLESERKLLLYNQYLKYLEENDNSGNK